MGFGGVTNDGSCYKKHKRENLPTPCKDECHANAATVDLDERVVKKCGAGHPTTQRNNENSRLTET